MKYLYITLMLFIIAIGYCNMYSQTIYTKTYITEKKGSYITEEEHYNGLGQLSCSQLPNGNVVYMRYDHQGRLIREGLPTPYSMQEYVMSGFFLDEFVEKTAPKYHNVSNPYTTIEYELGYQDRVSYSDISSFMPARNNYKLNDNYKDSFDDYRVTQFVLTDNGNLKKMGEYPKNTLRVKRTESHFLYFNYEFTNAYGQVVLTRSALETGKYDSAVNEIFEHLDTYYVYDDYGNLIYVLPPEAISKGTDFSPNDPVMKNYVYSYKYDYRNRCIEKKLPGVEPIKYIYDKTDRLIFSQDGENRKKGVWLFNFQDHFGEVLLQGICKTIDSKAITNERFENGIFKIELNNSNDLSKDPLKGYSVSFGNIPITLNDVKILVANYYSGDKVQRQNSNLLREPEYNNSSGFPNQHQSYYQYLIRASAIATSEEITKDDYIYTILSYNQDGLLSFSNNTTHRGGIQKQYIDYNYLGSIKEALNIYVNGEEKVSERNIYEYDDLNRLIETKHQFNSNPITSLSQIKYDQIGREESVKRGNNDKLTTSYKYNRVSQATNITTPKLFQQEVNYWHMTGDIDQIKYGIVSINENTVDYEYDNLHRLLKATKNKLPLSEYKYDKNGNILKTLNYQSLDNKSNELIDNLAFTYQGNQLTNISESVKAVNTKTFDFKDYSGGKGEMKYNLNGALYSDSHKKIKEILYNSQNLPIRLSVEGHPLVAGDIKYVYSAAGEKLQTVHSENKDLRNSPIIGTASYATVNPVVTTTDYVGNKIYEKVDNGKSVLKRVLIHGGYIDFINNNINNPRYNFYIADHLGNNRVVVNNEGNVLQRTNFYPFGMTAAESEGGEKQPYKYNDKELDSRLLLNTYDYSARYMDPAIGRFTSIDPHAENYYSWSPYAYVKNNPMKLIDPTGMDSWTTSDASEIERILAQIQSGGIESIDEDSFGEEWTRVSDDELVDGWGVFNDQDLSYTIAGVSYKDFKGYGKKNIGGDYWAGLLGLGLQSKGGTFTMFMQQSMDKNRFLRQSYLSAAYTSRGMSSAVSLSKFRIGLSQVGAVIGYAALGVGVASDGIQLRNHFINGEGSSNSITPLKAGINTGMSIIGTKLPHIGIGYHAIDQFYPNGWPGFLDDYSKYSKVQHPMGAHPMFGF